MNATSAPSPSRPTDLRALRERIAASAYVVDPVLVADALLRRADLEALGVLSPRGARSPRG